MMGKRSPIFVALAFLLAGCARQATPAKVHDTDVDIRMTFGELQTAVKEKNGAKIYDLLDADSRQDADKLAKTLQDMYARADGAKRAELAKKVGLPEEKLKDLSGKGFLGSELFHRADEHDEIPDVKALDRVEVKGEAAKVEYKDPDNPTATTTQRLVREDGHWRFKMGMPRIPE